MPVIPDRHELYRERPLSAASPASYVELASAASGSSLALYVGAGISVPTPTLLPTSSELLALLEPVVEEELGIRIEAGGGGEGVAVDAQASLESLADQAEAAGFLPAFRDLAASVVGFRDAPPNYSHRVLAVLLREGAVSVFSVNWDRCIERGAAACNFHIDVTVTEPDRAVRFANCRFHKIHGCASQPSSLLITSNELDEPPAWVGHVVGAALGADTLVFVGLGTVGGYVRARVAQVLEGIGEDAAVWLADPFPSRTWERLLERASEQHILEVDANSFFDDLLRACVRRSFAQLLAAARNMDAAGWVPPITPTVERLVEALSQRRALEVLEWLRAGAGGVADGAPMLHSSEGRTALLAVAIAAGAAPLRTRGEHERLVVEAGQAVIELAVWPELDATVLVARETARVSERHSRNCYGTHGPRVFHICVGHRGALARPEVQGDIGGGEVDEGDLVESEPQHYWIPAESMVQGMFQIAVPA